MAISRWLTTRADRAGRRLTLVIDALLMPGAGIVGVISPGGTEVPSEPSGSAAGSPSGGTRGGAAGP